jgi:two-component system sensor histidine kinase/response regulator
MMPHLSGFEVMDLLKTEIPPDDFLPILVLTADITQEAKLKALSGGAKDFLPKPFDLYEVRLRINNLLHTRYLHEQLKNQNLILEEKVKERTIELELANRRLELANRELSVLDQAKNGFLNMINHELRTPLNGILGFTGLLKSQIESPELIEYLDYLDYSAKRLERFSYQALLITTLQAGKYTVKPEVLSVEELFENAGSTLQKKITDKGISLQLSCNRPEIAIPGDRALIQICFERLIDNSVKYSKTGTEVWVKINATEQEITCEFIDQGRGFQPGILDNPFQAFVNHAEHVDQNTGLNILLIKYIMDAHSGRIELMNNPDKGATVKLVFNL